MSEANETTYPTWQQHIRRAQEEQAEKDAQSKAVLAAHEKAEKDEERARDAANFNAVLAYLGLPEIADSDVVVLDGFRLRLEVFRRDKDGDWNFAIEIETAEELPHTEYDRMDYFAWHGHLGEYRVATGGWCNPENADTQRYLRAELANELDTLAQKLAAAKVAFAAWKERRAQRQAAKSEPKSEPTLEERLRETLREFIGEVVQEVLENERDGHADYS